MDGNKHRPLGWNWRQYKLWSSSKSTSKKKHSQSEPSPSALCSTTFSPSTIEPCCLFTTQNGWSGGWESGGPCRITASNHGGVIYSRSHAGALQRYKCWARWGNCKGRTWLGVFTNTVWTCRFEKAPIWCQRHLPKADTDFHLLALNTEFSSVYMQG